MALSKDDVLKLIRSFLNECSQKHEIVQAYLFGSYATGKVKEYSDIDVAIVLPTSYSATHSFSDEDFAIFHEAQTYNSLLEVVCFTKDTFEQQRDPIVRRIKQEGILVMS